MPVVPSWGKVDQAITAYINPVVRCVPWHYYGTKRYYGDDGLKVEECRKMTFLPPAEIGYITRGQLKLEIA